MRRLACLLFVLASGCARPPGGPAPPREVVVFAAASLTDVAAALADSFETAHPDVRVTVSVGASSTLARQVAAGAPADVFLSASPEWTDTLAAAGWLDGPARGLAGNRLVVLGRAGAAAMRGPGELLGVRRLALADPAHVPAGRYAREALERAGLWERVAASVVPLPDVRAAAAAVETGAAEAAIVYASDARAATRARVLLVWPEVLAPRVRLTAAVVARADTSARADARALLAFVTAPARAATWQAFGFTPLSAGAHTAGAAP